MDRNAIEQERVNQAEDRRIRSDAQCERNDGNAGEGRRSLKAAKRVSDILNDGFNARREPDTSRFFSHIRLVAHDASRSFGGGLGREPTFSKPILDQSAVVRKLFAKVVVR
jgi:hypothetical protein